MGLLAETAHWDAQLACWFFPFFPGKNGFLTSGWRAELSPPPSHWNVQTGQIIWGTETVGFWQWTKWVELHVSCVWMKEGTQILSDLRFGIRWRGSFGTVGCLLRRLVWRFSGSLLCRCLRRSLSLRRRFPRWFGSRHGEWFSVHSKLQQWNCLFRAIHALGHLAVTVADIRTENVFVRGQRGSFSCFGKNACSLSAKTFSSADSCSWFKSCARVLSDYASREHISTHTSVRSAFAVTQELLQFEFDYLHIWCACLCTQIMQWTCWCWDNGCKHMAVTSFVLINSIVMLAERLVRLLICSKGHEGTRQLP